ncbi:hypothetical protein GQ42DRAFT_161242 [Ramicandelaber brevisporus]|nr:hypothetical protein GQ42DRAFT_161242 [Ramicandelaber brevisporus]
MSFSRPTSPRPDGVSPPGSPNLFANSGVPVSRSPSPIAPTFHFELPAGTATATGFVNKEDPAVAQNNPDYIVPDWTTYPINTPPRDRPVRIYCDGIYDLSHYGHFRALEQAKKSFPNVYLIVGCCNDHETHTRKGKTVFTEEERYESLRHCRWVDEVVRDAPWVITQEFIDYHQIDYVSHDDIPYASGDSDDVYGFVKQQGRFLPTQRTVGVSTSDLITRIVRDYDKYVYRNLERGVSAKELNISFFKEQELRAKKRVSEVKDQLQKNWHGTKDEILGEFEDLKYELKSTFSLWSERRNELIRDFTGLFGADNALSKLFSRKRKQYPDGTSSSTASSTLDVSRRPDSFNLKTFAAGSGSSTMTSAKAAAIAAAVANVQQSASSTGASSPDVFATPAMSASRNQSSANFDGDVGKNGLSINTSAPMDVDVSHSVFDVPDMSGPYTP